MYRNRLFLKTILFIRWENGQSPYSEKVSHISLCCELCILIICIKIFYILIMWMLTDENYPNFIPFCDQGANTLAVVQVRCLCVFSFLIINAHL